MWDFQMHFYVIAKSASERLFSIFDKELKPTIFLLGFLKKQSNNVQLVCDEPDEFDFKSTDFQDVPLLAEQLAVLSEDKKIILGDPNSRIQQADTVTDDAFREAILKVIQSKNYIRDKISFVSKSALINGYSVYVILELDRNTYDKYYSLTRDKIESYIRVDRSLLESAIKLFLKTCYETLLKANPGEDLSGAFDNSEELLRKSGEHFTYTISFAAHTFGQNNLFESLNVISSLRYEGEGTLGGLIIAAKQHSNISITVELSQPVDLSEYRKIRKLLQTVGQSSSIISDGHQVFGLGEIIGHYNNKEESLFVISFLEHYHWLITHDGQPLMRCKYGIPGLVKEGIDRDRFHDICKRIFSITKAQINKLLEVAMAATQQKHGALLVISSGAKEEAERLKNQSFSIRPIPLTSQNVLSFSSIDGAVLIDEQCVCHAIGVILDGQASIYGDASRGSRYNSAIRYVEFVKESSPCLVIVVSEDGMVDIIPNLRPQIRRSLIDEHIKKLSEIFDQETPDRKNFFKAYHFFEENAFYLSEHDCTVINIQRKILEEKFKTGGGLNTIRPDLSPSPEMNDTYYIK
ncbi:DNA integrity scanning protein DisA nucleotide-binding domain protein [Spirosoma sp. 48-14]|uniref:DNA integrity scanning protein DisA nucleotide-binding domain protein n=1 Tax=Spirosoma sp. 48-14 TaxID=1895854 RepID=UPI00095D779B|nr:DNA integrity scanning protein DisA nucleotide-binding domain protein [Spirosoma sp. 48-14]OJW77877.1 MAG: hypothetical protein BGO59_23975 [Spirosoma sp. 48-14]